MMCHGELYLCHRFPLPQPTPDDVVTGPGIIHFRSVSHLLKHIIPARRRPTILCYTQRLGQHFHLVTYIQPSVSSKFILCQRGEKTSNTNSAKDFLQTSTARWSMYPVFSPKFGCSALPSVSIPSCVVYCESPHGAYETWPRMGTRGYR